MRHNLFSAVYKVKTLNDFDALTHCVNVVGNAVKINHDFKTRGAAKTFSDKLYKLISRYYREQFSIVSKYQYKDDIIIYENVYLTGKKAPEIIDSDAHQRNKSEIIDRIAHVFKNEVIINKKLSNDEIKKLYRQGNKNSKFDNKVIQRLRDWNKTLNDLIDNNDKNDS